MSKVAVLLGGGGFAIEIATYTHRIFGYCDIEKSEAMSQFPNIEYLGNEQDVHRDDFSYLIASGVVEIRIKMIKFIKENHANVQQFISSDSFVSHQARIGPGALICPGAIIAGDADIGPFFLANAGVFVGHGCKLGQNVVLSPGAKVCGNAQVGDNVFVGANGVILPSAKIYDGAIIGANACAQRLMNGETAYSKTEKY